MSKLVENPEDRFFRNAAHIMLHYTKNFLYDPACFCNTVPFVITFQWPYPMGICKAHVFRGLNGVHQVTAVSRTCGCSFVLHN